MQEQIIIRQLETNGYAPDVSNIANLNRVYDDLVPIYTANSIDNDVRSAVVKYLIQSGQFQDASLSYDEFCAGVLYQIAKENIRGKERNNLAKRNAESLGLSVKNFERLLTQADYAYDTFKRFGPLYGNGKRGETPATFLISAEPIALPERLLGDLSEIGDGINTLFQQVAKIGTENIFARDFGTDADTVPIQFRVDMIFDGEQLWVNEIQPDNGANGLMDVEQAAYSTSEPWEFTASAAIPIIYERSGKEIGEEIEGIWIYDDADKDSYLPSYQRFSEFLFIASNGKVKLRTVPLSELPKDWSKGLDFYWNYSYDLSSRGYFDPGIPSIGPSMISPLCTKDIIPLIFFEKMFRDPRIRKLENYFPRTLQVNDSYYLFRKKDVIKVSSAAPGYESYMFNGKGVCGPWDNYANAEELKSLFEAGKIKLVRQRYVKPQTIETFVRSKEKGLVRFAGGNRICATFVQKPGGGVILTTLEATLAKNEPVKGQRECVMAPVVFK